MLVVHIAVPGTEEPDLVHRRKETRGEAEDSSCIAVLGRIGRTC